MTLFNDTDLFMSGTNGRKDFELPDADVLLIDKFFTKEEADYYYEVLLNNTNWKEYEMPMYDKIVTAPRMISWFQDKSDTIHSGDAPELTKELKEIRERVEVEVNLKFNAVLLNLYRNRLTDRYIFVGSYYNNTAPPINVLVLVSLRTLRSSNNNEPLPATTGYIQS